MFTWPGCLRLIPVTFVVFDGLVLDSCAGSMTIFTFVSWNNRRRTAQWVELRSSQSKMPVLMMTPTMSTWRTGRNERQARPRHWAQPRRSRPLSCTAQTTLTKVRTALHRLRMLGHASIMYSVLVVQEVFVQELQGGLSLHYHRSSSHPGVKYSVFWKCVEGS